MYNLLQWGQNQDIAVKLIKHRTLESHFLEKCQIRGGEKISHIREQNWWLDDIKCHVHWLLSKKYRINVSNWLWFLCKVIKMMVKAFIKSLQANINNDKQILIMTNIKEKKHAHL